jgi:hypothetical protein
MAVTAGPAPWNEGFRRANKRVQKQLSMDWALSSGWRRMQDSDWAGKPSHYKMKTIKLYNGRTVQVPDADYEDFIGHQVTKESDNPDSAIAEYIDGAKWTQNFEMNGGHISKIEYAPMRTLMDVHFTNGGDEVVFFRVPKETYSELLNLKDAGTFIDKHGVQRHILGKRFWDIVRVRGTQHSARYKFEYITHGSRGNPTKATYAVDSQAEVAKEAKRTNVSEENIWQEYIGELDSLAKRLSPSMKKDYDNLRNADAQKEYSAKEKFMVKHGIIEM